MYGVCVDANGLFPSPLCELPDPDPDLDPDPDPEPETEPEPEPEPCHNTDVSPNPWVVTPPPDHTLRASPLGSP